MEGNGIKKKLGEIQCELKAPKGQYNSFGKYKYRSCEDILEAVKPLLKKNGCVLKLSDDVVNIGDRFYVKATAALLSVDDDEGIFVTAWAREELEKKGQDGSQITGTASSYARKYALNGLFCIDDTKDADTDEYTAKTKVEKPAAKKAAPKQEKTLTNREKVIVAAEEKGISMKDLAAQYGLNGSTNEARFAEVLAELEQR